MLADSHGEEVITGFIKGKRDKKIGERVLVQGQDPTKVAGTIINSLHDSQLDGSS